MTDATHSYYTDKIQKCLYQIEVKEIQRKFMISFISNGGISHKHVENVYILAKLQTVIFLEG
jgi:hypothetical protein